MEKCVPLTPGPSGNEETCILTLTGMSLSSQVLPPHTGDSVLKEKRRRKHSWQECRHAGLSRSPFSQRPEHACL